MNFIDAVRKCKEDGYSMRRIGRNGTEHVISYEEHTDSFKDKHGRDYYCPTSMMYYQSGIL